MNLLYVKFVNKNKTITHHLLADSNFIFTKWRKCINSLWLSVTEWHRPVHIYFGTVKQRIDDTKTRRRLVHPKSFLRSLFPFIRAWVFEHVKMMQLIDTADSFRCMGWRHRQHTRRRRPLYICLCICRQHSQFSCSLDKTDKTSSRRQTSWQEWFCAAKTTTKTWVWLDAFCCILVYTRKCSVWVSVDVFVAIATCISFLSIIGCVLDAPVRSMFDSRSCQSRFKWFIPRCLLWSLQLSGDWS